jgi:hypothetical protein
VCNSQTPAISLNLLLACVGWLIFENVCSGSMPYAQCHYPFENKEQFEGGYPADFIAEGLDQTRGYTFAIVSHLPIELAIWMYHTADF